MYRPDRSRAAVLLLAVVALTRSALAADATAAERLSQALEMPAHRWLAEIRAAPGTALAPFTTDGCSGGMSSLWNFTAELYPAFAAAHEGAPPWEDCCVVHDRAYHAAGPDPDPEASYAARLAADEALRRCVVGTASARDDVLREYYGLTETQVRHVYEGIGAAMFHAVRLGGQPCTGLPWRWGYGYPHCWETLGQ